MVKNMVHQTTTIMLTFNPGWKVVPLWRTSTFPVTTLSPLQIQRPDLRIELQIENIISPSPHFSPSRLPADFLPFLVLPAVFLLAHLTLTLKQVPTGPTLGLTSVDNKTSSTETTPTSAQLTWLELVAKRHDAHGLKFQPHRVKGQRVRHTYGWSFFVASYPGSAWVRGYTST